MFFLSLQIMKQAEKTGAESPNNGQALPEDVNNIFA